MEPPITQVVRRLSPAIAQRKSPPRLTRLRHGPYRLKVGFGERAVIDRWVGLPSCVLSRLDPGDDNARAGLDLAAQQHQCFAAGGTGIRVTLAYARHVLKDGTRCVSRVEQANPR